MYGKCDDPKSPDYVPSVKMGYGSYGDNEVSASKSVDRYKRAVKRTADQKERECRLQLDFLMTPDGKENDHLPLQDLDCNVELEDKNGTGEFENYRTLFENAISENRILIDRLQQLHFENNVMKNKPPYIRATSLSLEKTEETTKFYTGLPSYSCFMWLVNFVTCIIPSSNILSSADILLLVLMKLRLNSPHTDISFRFGVSLSLVTNLIDSVIPQLAHKLKWLIHWPNKDDILRSRPDCFKEAFPRCVSVIDCTEVYIETPSNFTARSCTYSNYKHHNTIKFLVSIVPCGSISFVSRAFGGRTSDKIISLKSGYLDFINHGDVVLADRGFLIRDELASRGAELIIPSFVKGKDQLSAFEVERSRNIAHVRIHVEREMERLKNFRILSGKMSMNMVPHSDSIMTICSAIINMHPNIVQ
ncbi:uncharacterized protein LOC134707203 isoform X2 [Mytilus trossulus]|uniref:uncharacterized protein LOC134707203 isoform X2 n=1 Tax=Mytilus trossulus TaxID=6551 RepID=UPI003007169E